MCSSEGSPFSYLSSNYKDDNLDEPPLTSYKETYHQCETGWLPKHWVLMSHNNGNHMSTLLIHLDIPDHDLAVGIAAEARTSRMQQSIDVEITHTTTECIVIQLPDSILALLDSIPVIESSIDALENVNAMDIIEKDIFEDSIQKCIISLKEWENGDQAYQLPCFHVYHNPVCRYSMPPY
ncbi:hypothetical protein FCV25MIE_31894 [Fagus crenata]